MAYGLNQALKPRLRVINLVGHDIDGISWSTDQYLQFTTQLKAPICPGEDKSGCSVVLRLMINKSGHMLGKKIVNVIEYTPERPSLRLPLKLRRLGIYTEDFDYEYAHFGHQVRHGAQEHG